MNFLGKLALTLILTISFNFLASAQQTAEDFYQKGLELAKAGKHESAIPFFDEAIKLNSSYVEALLERSRTKSNNQKDLKGASADLETILQINPQHGEAYFERAQLRRSLFFAILEEKGGMPSKDTIPYYQLELEDLNSAIANGFKNKQIYIYRARHNSHNLDNQSDAIKDYTIAYNYDTDDVHLLMYRADAKRRDDDYQGANEDLRDVISRYDAVKTKLETPKQKLDYLKNAAVMALNNLSSVYALDEKPDLQLWAIAKSIELEPTPSAYISLARHEIIFGSLDEAIGNYTKAIELSNSKIGNFYMNRGIIYLLQEKPVEAEADFEQGRKLDSHLKEYNVRYWLELAKRQRAQKKVKVELPN